MKNLDIIFDLLSYDGAPSTDPADSVRVRSKIQETTMTAISRQQIQIADSTTDQAITIPDPNSDYLIILTDRDISVKLDGSADAIALKTRANGKKTLVTFLKGPITALTVSNASGDIANVDILVANK